jgi:hypothetical protein
MREFKIKAVKGAAFRNLMSWIGEVIAFIGGMAASAAWLGKVVDKIMWDGIYGLAFAWIVFIIAFCLWLRGILDDGVPNRWTIYLELLLPSLFSAAVGGRWGGWIDGKSNQFTHWLAVQTNVYVIDGKQSTSALLVIFSIITFGSSIFIARVWAPPRLSGNKNNAAPDAPGGTPTPAANRPTPGGRPTPGRP